MDDRMTMIKETLMSHICAQVGDIYNANCDELGEAIDMIKDLEEACYYHTITEAMNKKDIAQAETYYYTERYADYPNKMYYDDIPPRDRWKERQSYSEKDMPISFRDAREGKSPEKRRTYMESKELHMDKDKQMRELEAYMQELTNDLMDMIKDASPEEKQVLQKKVATLATKLNA